MNKYNWQVGGFCHTMNAQKVGEEIETLGKNVTAENIVKLARKKTSEMHNFFEWDDAKCGKIYRKQQANIILSSLEVEVTTTSPKQRKNIVSMTAYISETRDFARTSVKELEEMKVDLYSMRKKSALEELVKIKVKYSDITEIQDILKEV